MWEFLAILRGFFEGFLEDSLSILSQIPAKSGGKAVEDSKKDARRFLSIHEPPLVPSPPPPPLDSVVDNAID